MLKELGSKENLNGLLLTMATAGLTQGANEIGDAELDATSKAIAHALLGCAVGTATAGSSSGCAPGAAGAAIGEIVAGLYGDSQNLGDLEKQLQADPNNAALKQHITQIRNTVTELAKLTGAGGALLIGGDASDMQTAIGTAQNAAVNNYLNHTELKLRDQAQQACSAGNQSACQTVRALDQLSAERNTTIRDGVTTATEAQAGDILQSMQTTMQGLSDYRGELQTQLDNTTDPSQRASLQNQINQVDNNMKQVAALGKDYLAQQYENTGNPLYQSAFAQLSAATSGNDLADAMSSVMGVQLARLPTKPPHPSESAATAAAQSSIDLAAIQRAKVDNNFNAENDGWSNKPSGLNETTPVKDTFGKAPNDSDLATHLSTGGPSTQKGVFGAHADAAYQTELTSVGGIEISKTEIAPGVWERQYNTPDRIAAGKAPLTKTTYDSRWSDQQILEMSKQASSLVWTEFQRTGVQPSPNGVTTQINGIPFVTLFSKDKSGNIAVYSHPGKAKP